MLYFAYAANLNRSHMARLCPGAEPLFPATLEDFTLTVRKWFNVEPEEGGVVYGGVWRIKPEHLPRLDSYEDCPKLYERKMMTVNRVEHGSMGAWAHGREDLECLVYLMPEPFEIPLTPPDPQYLEMVKEGYREWGISSKQLDTALTKESRF